MIKMPGQLPEALLGVLFKGLPVDPYLQAAPADKRKIWGILLPGANEIRRQKITYLGCRTSAADDLAIKVLHRRNL